MVRNNWEYGIITKISPAQIKVGLQYTNTQVIQHHFLRNIYRYSKGL